MDLVLAELERLRVLAAKVDAIRNSIVGAQQFNWSEHAYPLVAALDEAGFPGEGHAISRANLGTLLERNASLLADLKLARQLLVDAQYGLSGFDAEKFIKPALAALARHTQGEP